MSVRLPAWVIEAPNQRRTQSIYHENKLCKVVTNRLTIVTTSPNLRKASLRDAKMRIFLEDFKPVILTYAILIAGMASLVYSAGGPTALLQAAHMWGR